MDETARKMLPYNKEYELKEGKYPEKMQEIAAGRAFGLFVSADGSQLKEVNRRAEIDATGTMCTEGIIKGNEKGGFVCMDETARKMLPYNKEYELKEGKYPEKMQEIAAGRAFFRAMGYGDVKIGDTVTLGRVCLHG